MWSLRTLAYTLPRPSEPPWAHVSQGQGVPTLHVAGQTPQTPCARSGPHATQRALAGVHDGATAKTKPINSPARSERKGWLVFIASDPKGGVQPGQLPLCNEGRFYPTLASEIT